VKKVALIRLLVIVCICADKIIVAYAPKNILRIKFFFEKLFGWNLCYPGITAYNKGNAIKERFSRQVVTKSTALHALNISLPRIVL
jgi:hypothetical protein